MKHETSRYKAQIFLYIVFFTAFNPIFLLLFFFAFSHFIRTSKQNSALQRLLNNTTLDYSAE